MRGSLAGAAFRLPIPGRWRDPIHPNAPAAAADIAGLYSLAEERPWRGSNDPGIVVAISGAWREGRKQ